MNSRTSNLYLGNPNPNATNQNLTVSNSAVSLTAPHTDTDYVIIDVQDNDVYITFDGTTPSASNGHVLPDGQGVLVISANAARVAKFIRATGSDGVIHATQFVD